MPDHDRLPALVESWNRGDRQALDEIVDLMYEDLRAIARRSLASERNDHTLSTTALVNEAYVKLSERTGTRWQGRSHFLALVSKVMRHLLIDYARRRNTDRRGGKQIHVPLDERRDGVESEIVELLGLDQALDKLGSRDDRMVRIVECRFFGGMSYDEIAEALGVSKRTVERDWTRARTYLMKVLSNDRKTDGAAR